MRAPLDITPAEFTAARKAYRAFLDARGGWPSNEMRRKWLALPPRDYNPFPDDIEEPENPK